MFFDFVVFNTKCLLLRTVSNDIFFVGGVSTEKLLEGLFLYVRSMGGCTVLFVRGDFCTIINPSSVFFIRRRKCTNLE